MMMSANDHHHPSLGRWRRWGLAGRPRLHESVHGVESVVESALEAPEWYLAAHAEGHLLLLLVGPLLPELLRLLLLAELLGLLLVLLVEGHALLAAERVHVAPVGLHETLLLLAEAGHLAELAALAALAEGLAPELLVGLLLLLPELLRAEGAHHAAHRVLLLVRVHLVAVGLLLGAAERTSERHHLLLVRGEHAQDCAGWGDTRQGVNFGASNPRRRRRQHD